MPRTLLDRSRPFGAVFGAIAAWSYEQDDKRFDAQGWEVVDVDVDVEGTEEEVAQEGQKRKRKPKP